MFSTFGCSGCPSWSFFASDWTFVSGHAPYKLKLAKGWKQVKSNSLNRHADFAATRGPLRFLVIPQPVQTVDGWEPPDAQSFKAASLQNLQQSVQGLIIEDDIDTMIGDSVAATVFSQGTVDGSSIFYITTFVVHNGWGYQIVCWAPLEHREALTAAASEILQGWSFLDPEPPVTASPETTAVKEPTESTSPTSASPPSPSPSAPSPTP